MEVQSQALHQPPLDEVASVLQNALREAFGSASVTVVDCPDLRQQPYGLAAPGICGQARLADVGGVPYLSPIVDRTKIYNFRDVAKSIGLPGAFFLGAGAGSHRLCGVNCEMMPNTNLATGDIQSYFAKVHPKDGSMVLEHYDSNEFSLLGNFLASEGAPGKVLKIEAEARRGDGNLVTMMRLALAKAYGDKPVGLGGVFVIEKGNAKLHVMPDFAEEPLDTDDKVQKWLKFYECHAPLTCLSVLVSHDPGMQLRVEHTHCFSSHGEGGHYHYDTTPADVKYIGYYSLGEQVYRVDAPPKKA